MPLNLGRPICLIPVSLTSSGPETMIGVRVGVAVLVGLGVTVKVSVGVAVSVGDDV